MKSPILKFVGRNVRILREQKGISQEQLGFLTGLHRTYIGGIERGERNLGVTNLVKIARALEVEPFELLKGIPIAIDGKDTQDDATTKPAWLDE